MLTEILEVSIEAFTQLIIYTFVSGVLLEICSLPRSSPQNAMIKWTQPAESDEADDSLGTASIIGGDVFSFGRLLNAKDTIWGISRKQRSGTCGRVQVCKGGEVGIAGW